MTTPLSPALKTQQDTQAFTDSFDGAFFLCRIPPQILESHDAASHLVVAQNERKLRAALVGALELRLEAAAAQIDLQLQAGPGVAQLFRQTKARNLGALARQHQIHVRPVAQNRESLLLQQHHDALLPHRPADAGDAGAAQLLHQAVVAAAGAHRALRTESIRGPLEDRARVVIEPAHQMGLGMILDAGALEVRAQGLEMRLRFRIQRVEQQRRPGDDPLHVRVLAVEDAQRIAVQAPPAILIQGGFMRAEISCELVAIGGARGGGAERIDEKLQAREAQPPQQPRRQQNHFRIDVRTREAECLRVDLMELTISSRLRPLAPEHRAHAPYAQPILPQQTVGYHGPHDSGGGFRTQGNVIFALVDEAEHFLFDDVRKIADRALEQLRLLDDRDAEFLVAVARKNLARDALQVLPCRGLCRQHVVDAAKRLDDLTQE